MCVHADGLLYMLDTSWTLHALVRAWGASAALLLGKEAALVASLAGIHDELLPDLANACHRLELQGNHGPTCSLVNIPIPVACPARFHVFRPASCMPKHGATEQSCPELLLCRHPQSCRILWKFLVFRPAARMPLPGATGK